MGYVELSFCRKVNRSAHLVVKHALGIDDFSARIEEHHCFLEQVL